MTYIDFSRELVETPDGGLISLDWLDNDKENMLYPDADKRPTVLILPGLTGSYSVLFYQIFVHSGFSITCESPQMLSWEFSLFEEASSLTVFKCKL